MPPSHIHETRFKYDPDLGEIQSIARVPAGYGKVAVLDELQAQLQISPDRIVYVGGGSSDVHVMLHVNRRDGFTIAILEDIVGWKDPARMRVLFGSQGFRFKRGTRCRQTS